MAICRAPGCGAHYTATRSWQKYCSDKCRNSQHTRRLAADSSGAKVLDAAMVWYRANGHFTNEARLRDACERYALEFPTEGEP